MIPVTKSYLPNKEKYKEYIDYIYDSCWLTNNGGLLQSLELRLAKYLGVKHLICVANGSLALQLAYKALELKGEVITTPFSFAATTSTLAWEGLKPIFADICPNSFNMDPNNIEKHVSKYTSAIVPVHVFGNPCEVEEIQRIATENNLKVIYDAAHAFDTKYTDINGNTKSVLNYGDISTLSFHATKIFHTIEGGAVITNDDELAKKIRLMINFGISSPTTIETLGTNAKMNELEAAMGLCILDEIDKIKTKRKKIWDKYKKELKEIVRFQMWNDKSENNHSYAPIIMESEEKLIKIIEVLNNENIFPRRYFYPSLDNLIYLKENKDNSEKNKQYMNFSNEISRTILCLPMYQELKENEQEKICDLIKSNI